MDKQQARQIIKRTFEDSFDKIRFTTFIKNLLNHIDEGDGFTYQGIYIPEKFRAYVKSLERVGKFSDGKNSLDILIITLDKETSLERARTMQRNLIAWYLNGSRGGKRKDAALVAYVSPGQEDWRFSLVKMDYKFEETETGKVRIKEEFTPARRWSFLVGVNEKSHTAQSRLMDIVANDEQAPTLAELENAFDIETVSKEFFLKYRELFLSTKDALDEVVKSNPRIKADFEGKGVDTVNFAKKLMGQIVFLYFLQKKGWFGVGCNDDWGTGSRHFLRELFEKKHGDYINFFNDILEPLFYEALRIDRSYDDDYYSRFNCKIPFLNGGLFDPIGNYDWVHTDINLPNDLFSNSRKTKEGDIGDGILDVFDRYNFTVREDEPLEKEVAIDPELLGKAYEKFNAVRSDNFEEFIKALKSSSKGEESEFNRKYGVYYTPPEIVHYMCKQSLIHYLYNQAEEAGLGNTIKKQDIEQLIEVGEMVTEHEATALIKQEKIKRGIHKSTGYTACLAESIRGNAAVIDKWLEEITVCDPAVGSGAFPVGMMTEIVHARNVLSVFMNGYNRSDYEFKRRCIEHSLYGVDIDPGAVEIAKLRLWLSLVVDEEDIKNIKPLPNLDYKIMQGNSLVSEFMEVNFDLEGKEEGLAFKDKTNELIDQFQKKKVELFTESNVTQKNRVKKDVENLLVEIFETKLISQRTYYNNRLEGIEKKYAVLPNEELKEKLIKQEKKKIYKESGIDLHAAEKQLKEFSSGNKVKPFFLWSLYFSEVFHKRGGFDVVIGNPPYVSTKGVTDKDKKTLEAQFGFADDLYNHFYFKGIKLLKENGILTYISSKTFWTIQTKRNLRELLLKNKILQLVDAGNPFESPMVDTCITIVQKNNSNNNSILVVDAKEDFDKREVYKVSASIFKDAVNNAFFIPNDFNLKVYEKLGKPLKQLMDKWWDFISTSKNIGKYQRILHDYRNNLKPGDITLLGLITEGGQGLATANNGKYVGVLAGTKYAYRVKEDRAKKILEFVERKNLRELSHLKDKNEAEKYLNNLSEIEIRDLFDKLKEKYGRDIFGQGWLYRIVSKDEVADVETLTHDERLNGIRGKKTFVPYDKGDKEGNRWWAPTPYYIDWSRENVRFLKENSGKKGEGMPVVRNPQFYFREGFCWSDIHTVFIKCRIKEKGIHDVKSMSLFSLDTIKYPDYYLVTIINSTFISKYVEAFVKNAQTFQINDARQVPIIIPTEEQLRDFESIFNRAVSIQKQKFSKKINEQEAEKRLEEIQRELDERVLELYGLK